MIKRIFYTALFLALSFSVVAQQSTAIKNLERQRKQALEDIETTSKLLSETKQTTGNLLLRLNLLLEQINSRRKVISLLNQEIEQLNKELNNKINTIQLLEKDLQKKRSNYAQSLSKMQHKKKSQDYLLFILSSESFSQSYRRIRYLREYAQWQKVQAKEINEKQVELQKEKEALEKGKQEKEALLQQKEQENSRLQREEQTKQTEVKGLKQKEKTLQAQLAKKRKQAQELNRRIEKAIEEEIRKAEEAARLEAAKAAEKKKGAEVDKATKTEPEKKATSPTETYAMTKEQQNLSAHFSGNRGKLPFPVKGRYKIVAQFGKQQHQELKYVTVENNGIEIQTTAGAEAYAVFNGVVSSVFVVPGYSNSVIIQHGNYRTIYANLEEVYIKKGQKVSTGQKIGKIFIDTEKGNSSILYFEIRKDWSKLDPVPWLTH